MRLTTRFLETPEGWHKNPDCDLIGCFDLISARCADPGTCPSEHPHHDHHMIDVSVTDDLRYLVALDLGIHDIASLDECDHAIADTPLEAIEAANELAALLEVEG